MKELHRTVLEQLINSSAEPVVVAQTSSADWPVVLANPAFETLAGESEVRQQPFADVIEQMFGRSLALEISESIRARRDSAIPVDVNNQEFVLVLKFLQASDDGKSEFFFGYLRQGAGAIAAGNAEIQQALVNAQRRIRDMSREDPVTGLLNARAFRDVLDHDWAVAKREESCLALVVFTLDDFEKYREVFGRHAADSCLRKVAGAIRRCLKRASDVVARIDCCPGEKLVVLSHSSDELQVQEFGASIVKSVRQLGLHHPRSKTGRFVTVSYQVTVRNAGATRAKAAEFIESVLS